MEKIEKTREVVNTITDVSYKAIDGTIFNNESACKEYEDTVAAVILAKIKEFQIKEIDGTDLFESNDEGYYRIVVPTKTTHIDLLNQLWKLFGGEKSQNLVFDKKDLNHVIAVGVRMYNDKIDWIWFWKVNNVIMNITDNKYTIIKSPSIKND